MPARWIRVLQFLSIAMMWAFGVGIVTFVPWLVFVATRWNDAPTWSLIIAVVMTPIYVTVAATLTYVFVGLQRGIPEEMKKGKTDG